MMEIPKDFSTWFAGTDEGREVIAQAAKDGVAERVAMVQEIAELREALRRVLPAPLKAVESAAKKAQKARQALVDAEAGLQRAQGVVQNVTYRAETQIGQLEQQLREGAHPGIAEFTGGLEDLWDRERRDWTWSAPRHKGLPMPARDRVAQIRAIGEQAERLMFEPDPEAAERELSRLRNELATPKAAA